MKYIIFIFTILQFNICFSQTKKVYIDHDDSYPIDSILTFKDGKLDGQSKIFYRDSSGSAFRQTITYKNGTPIGKSILIDCDNGLTYKVNFLTQFKTDTILIKPRRAFFKRSVRRYAIGRMVRFEKDKCISKTDKKYGVKDTKTLGCIMKYSKTKRRYKHNLRIERYLTRRNGVDWRKTYYEEIKLCNTKFGF